MKATDITTPIPTNIASPRRSAGGVVLAIVTGILAVAGVAVAVLAMFVYANTP